jgi:dihydrofolate reductase
MSLDGYIAGPNGEADWIIMDPEIDFGEIFQKYDAFLIGRRTFEGMLAQGHGSSPGTTTLVFSRTLNPADHPGVTIVADDAKGAIEALKAKPGKDIWLFGGGSLFRSLLEDRLVDVVGVAIIPVLLGGGIPLLPSPAGRAKLELTTHKVYKTGIVALEYDIKH